MTKRQLAGPLQAGRCGDAIKSIGDRRGLNADARLLASIQFAMTPIATRQAMLAVARL